MKRFALARHLAFFGYERLQSTVKADNFLVDASYTSKKNPADAGFF